VATPRSPYVCIGDALLWEPWPFEIKAALVMLSCHMHVRWRTDRRLSLAQVAAAHPLDRGSIQQITGKGRRDIALKSLRSLAEVASISLRSDGEIIWVSWPKWAEYNSMHSRSQGPDGARDEPLRDPRPSSSSSPTPEESTSSEKSTDIPAASKTPRPARVPAAWSIRCSEILIELLRPVAGARIPRGSRDRWAAEIEALAREAPELSNGSDPSQHIEAAIRWALGPDNLGREYEVVIRSGRSLREKWPKLVAAAKRRESKRPVVAGDLYESLMDKHRVQQ
jgi:hypothetical protein